jgi:hypothetical protein
LKGKSKKCSDLWTDPDSELTDEIIYLRNLKRVISVLIDVKGTLDGNLNRTSVLGKVSEYQDEFEVIGENWKIIWSKIMSDFTGEEAILESTRGRMKEI